MIARQVVLNVLLSLAMTQATASPFNSYAVLLDSAPMPGGCSVADTEHFRNRTYSFRGATYEGTSLTLHDGKALELNELKKPEWETQLTRQSVVTVGGQSAVILQFFRRHLGGTGSWTEVLIGTCSNRQLTVIFEAEGQGVSEVAFTTDQDLIVRRLVWSPTDARCCPSGKAEEHYRWDRNTGRFLLIGGR